MADENTLTIIIKGDAAQFTRTIAMVEAGIKRANQATREFGHTGVTSMQAASASIRLLEGDITRNVRAVERFLTMLPGVGTALKAAFPVVGALALGGVIYRLSEEVYKFIDGVLKVPKALQDGFRDLNLSAQLANDQLAVTNDRLAMQIAKLEHRPQNGLALALDEARVRADELAKALLNDVKIINDLLEKQKIGIVGEFLGKGGTGDVSRFAQDINDQITRLADRMTEASFQHDEQGMSKARQELASFIQTSIEKTKSQLASLPTAQPELDQFGRPIPGTSLPLDNTANQTILQGLIRNLENRAIYLQEMSQNEGLEKQLGSDQARQQKLEDARRAAEELHKVQQQIIKNDEDALEALKASEDVTKQREIQFWMDRVLIERSGSESCVHAVNEANKVLASVRAENVRSQAEFEKTASSPVNQTDLAKTDQAWLQQQGKAAADLIKNINEYNAIQRGNADAIAQFTLQMEVATGRMSRLDAAQMKARLHAQEYAESVAQLHAVLQQLSSDPTLSIIEKSAKIAEVNNQLAQLEGQRQIQIMQDNASIYATGSSAMVGVKDALNDFIAATRDAAGQMRQIAESTLRNINDQLLNAMTGKRTGFAGVGEQLFRAVAGFSLEKAEGSILSAFGLGPKTKPDGTQSNPFWVKSADQQSAAGGISSLLGGMLGIGGGEAGGEAAGGFSFGDIISSLPFFADGGPIPSNLPAIVGERGPELFIPRSAGTIVPNDMLGNGGGHTFHFNVDARGATDPAGVRAQVMAGIREMTPHIIGASVAAQQDMKRRYPTTKK